MHDDICAKNGMFKRRNGTHGKQNNIFDSLQKSTKAHERQKQAQEMQSALSHLAYFSLRLQQSQEALEYAVKLQEVSITIPTKLPPNTLMLYEECNLKTGIARICCPMQRTKSEGLIICAQGTRCSLQSKLSQCDCNTFHL